MTSDASRMRDAAAKVARGRVYKERYREWPEWGTGNRGNDSEITQFADAIARAIEALPLPAPAPDWNAAIEAAAKKALEYVPWDMACTAIAADIRALTKPSSLVDEAAGDREAGWLIELHDTSVYYLSLDKTVLGYWTHDGLLATRFGRKQDALAWLNFQDVIDRAKVQIHEHYWIGPRAVLRQTAGETPDQRQAKIVAHLERERKQTLTFAIELAVGRLIHEIERGDHLNPPPEGK